MKHMDHLYIPINTNFSGFLGAIILLSPRKLGFFHQHLYQSAKFSIVFPISYMFKDDHLMLKDWSLVMPGTGAERI